MPNILRKITIFLLLCICFFLEFNIVYGQSMGTIRQLTSGNYVDAQYPDWSPDGQWVVYQKEVFWGDYNAYYIYKVRVSDKYEVRLTQYETIDVFGNTVYSYCDSKPVFSPNGKQIAFQRGEDIPGYYYDSASIWVMNADGTNQRRVAKYREDENSHGGAQFPQWSSDGKWIGYWFGESYVDKSLFIVRPDGTGAKRVTPVSFSLQPEKYFEWGPLISKTAKNQIVVSMANIESSYERHIALIDLCCINKIRWLTNPYGQACQFSPSWSPDGKKIVYNDDFAGSADIWVMNADGSNKIRLTNSELTGYCYRAPSWSPNGRYILYMSEDDNTKDWYKSICIMTSNGKYSKCITETNTVFREEPLYTTKFNPQGTKIVFTGRTTNHNYHIFVVDLDTADPDQDGLLNWEEDVWGTSRSNKDSDGDGVSDGSEVKKGTDPLVK